MYRCGAALRHRNVRVSSEGAWAKTHLPAGEVVLIERSVVREDPSAVVYPKEVRDVAAYELVNDPSRWCLIEGKAEEERSANSRLKEFDTIKCQIARMYKLSSSPNATMLVSPFEDDDTIVITLSDAVKDGEEITVGENVTRARHSHESEGLWKCTVELGAAERALERWASVDVQTCVEEADQKVHKCKAAVAEYLREVRAIGPEWLVQVSNLYVDPGLLPQSKCISSLHCERAAEIIDIRETVGVRDATNNIQDALEAFKKYC